ncbi:MAG: hypothetical protein OEZ10_08095 [Gammaproteobacteria bacterium]|nr:hypothetical protein [Gammaproteobacteria bacterium]
MKYLDSDTGMLDADGAEDAVASTLRLEQQIDAARRQIEALPENVEPTRKAELDLQVARALAELERGSESWDIARNAFDVFLAAEDFEQAAIACDILFNTGEEGALSALGQGIWLAVTFPVDPELSVALLQHVVDETPDDSDGGALAAVVAHYIADMRTQPGRAREDLLFFTNNLLGTVARRHSKVDKQDEFDFWFRKLELHDPALFLPRFRNVVDVLVQDDWWFDREQLQERLPVN